MSVRTLPKADLPAKPGAQPDLRPAAIERWNPGLAVSNEAESERSISILDPIGSSFFSEGVTSKRIAAALRNMGDGPVTVNVNSPGGDFFEGLAIYNLLREHNGEVTVKVLGIAASAASAIAMSGDTIQIAQAGFFMIHNTQVMAGGDRHALRQVADWLEPFDDVLAGIYEVRTGQERKPVAKMLDKETWIGGAKAVEMGFADALLPSDYVASDAASNPDAKAKSAVAKADALFASLNIPRSERRSMIAALKGGTPSAAQTDMPSAVGGRATDATIMAGAGALLEKLSLET